MNRNTVITLPGTPSRAEKGSESKGQNAQTGAYENPRAAARRAAELLYQEQRRRLHAVGKRERQ